MREREKLLKELSAAQFAAWETHLFLDTHPCDTAAMQSLAMYQQQALKLREQFEKRFGPLTTYDMYGDKRFEWLNSPWPWDTVMEAMNHV